MAVSGSRDSLGGVEGVGEVSVIDGSCVEDFLFQIAIVSDAFRWSFQGSVDGRQHRAAKRR